MKPLDLNSHDPEEYEGKSIIYNECEYVIGEYVGSGSDRITHKLINRRSKLCIHVLKIIRDLEHASSHAEVFEESNKKMRYDPWIKDIVPFEKAVKWQGSAFTIQDYAKGYEDFSGLQQAIESAEDAKRRSEFQKALSEYKSILNANPYHTVVLNNLCHLLSEKLGQKEAAYESILKAVEIEPNYLTYHLNLISCTVAMGHPQLSLTYFERMRKQFSYIHNDNLAADLYLQCGEPEAANKLLLDNELALPEEREPDRSDNAKSPQTEEGDHDRRKMIESHTQKRKEMQQKIAEDISAKNKAMKEMQRAKELILSGKETDILDILKKAYALYSKDPLVILNLALALHKKGNIKEGNELLLSQALGSKLPPNMIQIYYVANAAFGEIERSSFETAIPLLDFLDRCLKVVNHGPIDLPGKTEWFEPEAAIIEGRPHEVLELIDYAMKKYSQIGQVPDSIKRLRSEYAKAVKLYDRK